MKITAIKVVGIDLTTVGLQTVPEGLPLGKHPCGLLPADDLNACSFDISYEIRRRSAGAYGDVHGC